MSHRQFFPPEQMGHHHAGDEPGRQTIMEGAAYCDFKFTLDT